MKRGIKIIHNKARCKSCGTVIESRSVHDFVGCVCFVESKGRRGIAVDGGHEYLRRVGNPDEYEDLSETRSYTDEEVDEYNKRQDEMAKDYSFITPNYMEKSECKSGN